MAVDPAFRNVENIMGLKIWRIESMEVKAIPKEDYGHFFEGDSYICLHVSAKYLWHWSDTKIDIAFHINEINYFNDKIFFPFQEVAYI